MGCLFGYVGQANDNLLTKMATRLSHRCHQGWEKDSLTLIDGTVLAVGRGISRWGKQTQIAQHQQQLMAYDGVFFEQTTTTNLCQANQTSRLTPEFFQPFKINPETAISTLTGAYVFAYSDGRTCYLCRDHAGIKTLYWTVYQGYLLFASEIKALFAYAPLPRRMRYSALPEYFTFSFIPTERTMFENIYELQAGTYLRFQAGEVHLQRYFTVETGEWTADAPPMDYVELVRSRLIASTRDCLQVSRHTPAVFLSGGIDSSSVLATACQLLPEQQIPTFSVHFGTEYPNENEFVRLMVERYKTDHHWLHIRPRDFLEDFREIIWRLDDPIGDPVTVPNYLLAREAAKITDVVLNGEGGDPCFGGPKNIPMLLARLYGALPNESHGDWLERNYLHTFQRAFTDLSQLFTPDILRGLDIESHLTQLLTPFFQAEKPVDFLNKLMCMNMRLKGANLILVKVDKMSSANQLLALPPLFSKQIMEASLQCPPALKLEGSIEKSVLKKAMMDFVPLPIIQRPKSGMMVPVRFWFQGEMQRYGKRLLSKSFLKRTGLFNPEYVQKLISYDMETLHTGRHGLKLWMLITFLLWYEQMIEAKN
ncbi:asparagine synthase (glutamine-hydrolyzing) [Beggiatoa alba B18LD]|uniref:asparagine synthase (glutamine-hydrolyzing) n=1 Tax=Beggiatoa alba B18LD TaxID=395493 RepID=I3CGE4_9GAMM|nr:asparagine synthase-related protein [Beggiatoa alba]EIJ42687.1 asparagine synthase (glutamine-hydrolyzing) [Beggiatoa alba B18LD]